MLIARRSLLAASSLAALPTASWARDLSRGVFTHGVASGDPLPDGVVIWTRFAGAGEGRVAWEVAEDDAFRNVAQRGEATASFANDFCVKADVRGLAPGRRYFYRFLSAGDPSPTGQTLTSPADGAESLSIALFSCANFAWGHFHAYGHAASRDDIDLVVHAGDYIYEVERGAYPNDTDAVPGRLMEPVRELNTLADYYQRYAFYHTDPDLLELRRLKPISAVWDDHEIADNTWREGALAHYDPVEGPFANRVAAASKAYFDWMPIRRPDPRGVRLYRSLDWGNLARIILLDTRLTGRDRQIDYRGTLLPRLADGGADAAALAAEFRRTVLDDPSRTMLGAQQEAWFAQTLSDSQQRGQTWQIVAQQVVMGEQLAPSNLTSLLPDTISSGSRQFFSAGERVSALGLPWNLDSWGGYPAARARFLQACTVNANNAVVLGGDSHNCWVNSLSAAEGDRLAALEFAGGSVSSPGFERSLTRAAPGQREAMLQAANPHLAWCDLTHRGYARLRFTRETCDADWIAFEDVRSAERAAPATTRLTATASSTAGPGAWTL